MGTLGWSHYEDLDIDDGFEYGTRYAVSEFFETEEFRFSLIRFDPGEGGPLHYHNEPEQEYYYVVDGTLDIQLGDEIVEADAGTILFTPPGEQHQPMNNYDEPAVLLSAITPNRAYLPEGEGGVVVVEDYDGPD